MKIERIKNFIIDNHFALILSIPFYLIFIHIPFIYWRAFYWFDPFSYFGNVFAPKGFLNMFIYNKEGYKETLPMLTFFIGTNLYLAVLYISINANLVFKDKYIKWSVIPKLYFLYLTPVMITWLYPVLIDWFNTEAIYKNYVETGVGNQILACYFILGLIFTIFQIVKARFKNYLSSKKEEIKSEIILEIKNNGSKNTSHLID